MRIHSILKRSFKLCFRFQRNRRRPTAAIADEAAVAILTQHSDEA